MLWIMKVLFLDIDGVLNSIDNSAVMGFLWKQDNENKSRDEFGRLFDERCVRWLKYIFLKTDCKIVISSSWRRSGLKTMQLMWEMRDLPSEVIDITPNVACEHIVNLYASSIFTNARGYEIQEWIDKHKPENYCIVDDIPEMLPHQNFVQTNGYYGLTLKEAEKVIEILNN